MKKIWCFALGISAVFSQTISTNTFDSNNKIAESNADVNFRSERRAQSTNVYNQGLFFEDTYVDQDLLSNEEMEAYRHLESIGQAPRQKPELFIFVNPDLGNSGGGTTVYTDNESKDGRESGATLVGEVGFIKAKLNIKDGWTQFWNSIGEIDEDFYRFTINEQKTMIFNYSGPSNYYIRLLRYGNPSSYICTSLGSFSIDLEPSTYYIHIYTEKKEFISDEEYHILYQGSRTTNIQDFYLTEGSKKEYGMVMWENEKYPVNSTRHKSPQTTLKYRMKPRRGKASNLGFVDPLFYTNESKETLTDEIFLDSIIYIWGDKILSELSYKLSEMRESLRIAIYERKVNEIRAEYRNESINGVSTLIIDLVGNLTSGNVYSIAKYTCDVTSIIGSFLLSFIANIDFEEAIKDFNIGYWLGSLSQACFDCSVFNGVLRLPKYYFFNKVSGNIGNNTLKTYSWKRISTFIPFGVDNHSAFIYQDEVISPRQYISETNKTYTGRIIGFKNTQEFYSYIDGNEGGNSISTHEIHEYNEVFPHNENYHVFVCKCGKEDYALHEYSYDGTLSVCEYCEYTPNLDTIHILSNKYYFSAEYNTVPIEQNIVAENNEVIRTNRLRCGVINDYLALSAKSDDADKAYLEYFLSHDAVEVTYELGLWSDNESLIKNSSIRFEVLIDGEWIVQKTFDAKAMSTDKDNLLLYTEILEIPASGFRFIVETNKVNNTNNRGRIVIGDISLKQIV